MYRRCLIHFSWRKIKKNQESANISWTRTFRQLLNSKEFFSLLKMMKTSSILSRPKPRQLNAYLINQEAAMAIVIFQQSIQGLRFLLENQEKYKKKKLCINRRFTQQSIQQRKIWECYSQGFSMLSMEEFLIFSDPFYYFLSISIPFFKVSRRHSWSLVLGHFSSFTKLLWWQLVLMNRAMFFSCLVSFIRHIPVLQIILSTDLNLLSQKSKKHGIWFCS